MKLHVKGLFVVGVLTGTSFRYGRFGMQDPCVYCGGSADTWEHVVPKSWKQKQTPFFNRVRACAKCNTERGSKPLLAFLATRRGYGIHV